MKEEQLITVFDIVSFIVGIASIVLAIVSLVLSILFYKWGKDASNLSSQLTTNRSSYKISKRFVRQNVEYDI